MTEVAAIILAAGRASRFEAGADDSKVLAAYDGASLVARVAGAALRSRAASVQVVTGHAGAGVAAALAGLAVSFIDNPAYATGMASSLKAGVAAAPGSSAAAVVLLADMPLVRTGTIDALIAAFGRAADEIDAVVPVYEGRRGNPVLLSRTLFEAVGKLEGDEGARKLLGRPGVRVATCAVDDPGIMLDIDTRDALTALHSRTTASPT